MRAGQAGVAIGYGAGCLASYWLLGRRLSILLEVFVDGRTSTRGGQLACPPAGIQMSPVADSRNFSGED